MDNSVMNKKRLLLNAEPFGFGPTAAIADCFPFLREHFSKVGYVGVGFTLDLQRPLPYDSLHDVTGVSQELLDAVLADIFSQYDVFLTALDFGMAEKAKAAGLTVIIYDPLTWYWKTIPPVVKDADLYIAQDFFGVRERLEQEAHLFNAERVRVVPPIIGDVAHAPGERDTVLLNLGGLNNPFWSAEGTLAYARLIVEAFASVAGNVEVIITANKCIAANALIAQELAEFGVKNLSRAEMQEVLKGAKFALMTPGLGNVYDAARFDIPTIWLPPANDSQGQQLFMLLEAGTGGRSRRLASPFAGQGNRLQRRANGRLEEDFRSCGENVRFQDGEEGARAPSGGEHRVSLEGDRLSAGNSPQFGEASSRAVAHLSAGG